MKNIEQFTYPNNWINLPTITPPHYLLWLFKINHSLVHEFIQMRQAKQAFFSGTKAYKVTAAETKGNLEIQRQREGPVKSIRGVAGDQK